MFDWLLNALVTPIVWAGQIVIDIIGNMLGHLLYEIFVLFPLKLLRLLELFFDFLASKGPTMFLFDVKYEDGHNIMSSNFFTHPSPMQMAYIIMMSIAGVFGVIFMILGIAKHMAAKKPGDTHSKLLQPALVMSGGVFSFAFIPVVVLFLLSGVGALTQIFSGKVAHPPSLNDVTRYKQDLGNGLKSIYSSGSTGDLETIYGQNLVSAVNSEEITDSDGTIYFNGFTVPIWNANTMKWEFKQGITPENARLENYSTNPTTPLNLEFHQFNDSLSVSDYFFNAIEGFTGHWLSPADNTTPSNELESSQTIKQAITGMKMEYDLLVGVGSTTSGDHVSPFTSNIGHWNPEFIKVLDDVQKILTNMSDQKNEQYANSLRRDIKVINGAAKDISNFKQSIVVFNDTVYQSGYVTTTLNAKFPNGYDSLLASGSTPSAPVWDASAQRYMQEVADLMTFRDMSARWINYGDLTMKNSSAWENPRSLNQLGANMARLVGGNPYLPPSASGLPISLNSLKGQLTTIEDSTITVTMYQIASGHDDANWEVIPDDINMGLMFIGTVAIIFAIYMMMQLCVYTTLRIFDIGVLFVTGPMWIMWGAQDGGAKAKRWAQMLGAKIFAIVAVVIAYSLIGPVCHAVDAMWSTPDGQEILDAAQNIMGAGSSVVDNTMQGLAKGIVKLLFIFGGLIGAKAAAIEVSLIFGANAGIAEAMGQLRSLKGGAVATLAAGKTIAKGVKGGGGAVVRNSGLSAESRARWGDRAEGAKLAFAAKGMSEKGTAQKAKELSKKHQKITAKVEKATEAGKTGKANRLKAQAKSIKDSSNHYAQTSHAQGQRREKKAAEARNALPAKSKGGKK